MQEIYFPELFAAYTVGLWNRDEFCLNKFCGLLFIWILTKIKSLTSSIEILWIANGEHVVFLSQKLINYTLTINPWEQMNTKKAILASLNGGFYFLGFRSLSLCCLIFGQLYFSGFYFSKKIIIMYTERPENSVYKIDGWWNALDHFTIGKSWVSHMVEISAHTSNYDVFLLIWTPAWSLCVSCKVKISQELACELKEKSFKIKCFFVSSFSYRLLKGKWRRQHSWYFILFSKFLTHIYQMFRHDLSS